MRRVILGKVAKRAGWGLFFIALSYVITITGAKKLLLALNPGIGWMDFAYVLAVAFLPEIVSAIGYGILFSVATLLLRYFFLPVHMVERHYMGIKAWGYRKPIVICAIVVFLVFLMPFFMRSPATVGETLTGAEGMVAGFGQSGYSLGEEMGDVVGLLTNAVASLFDAFILKPLYLFSPVRLDAFIAGIFLSALFLHSLTVSICKGRISVDRRVSRHVFQQGENVIMETTVESPFPMPNVYIPSAKAGPKRVMGRKQKTERDAFGGDIKNTEDLRLSEGYYNFDIVPVSVFTLPAFHTTVYRVCASNADVSVLPALKFRSRIFSRRPSVTREGGSLIRKQLGSSMDFANMRPYTHDDPFSRIWWKGLAKYGTLMVKEYHSYGEDRWMLVLDLTNPNMGEEKVKEMLRFARLFIELCTRKDIAVGISVFSPTFHYVDFGTDKKDLLTSLTKVTSPVFEMSQKGMELILRDAVGKNDMEKLMAKCRKKRITPAGVYSYSGLGKSKTFFSWRGSKVFADCTKGFFTNMRKSGKVVVVTDGSPGNVEAFRKFKAVCERRRCRYIFVVTEEKKGAKDVMKAASIKSVLVPYEDLAKPGFVASLVGVV